MRKFYSLIFTLILPLILLRLYWRGRKAPDYRLRWQERLGIYVGPSLKNVVWFHTVSVGEAEAAFPLVRAMLAEYPDIRFLLTSTTPTGSARIRAVLGDQVAHVYLPYDVPWSVERFLNHFQPRLAVFLEKELWPNLFSACAERQIPLFVVNARLSDRSARAYQKLPSLIWPTLNCIRLIAAQTEEDRRNFIAIGAEPQRVQVLGNIKFDLSLDDSVFEAGRALKQDFFGERWVWIIASSHHDEEARLLPLYRQLKPRIPELLLMIAPRHPERFQPVARLCIEQDFNVVTRSSGVEISVASDVYLADSLGELKMLYAAADVAFVGGSLVEVGGHNVLEPAAVGVPVLFGPIMFNFQDVADRMLQAEAAIQCPNLDALAEAILNLHDSEILRRSLIDNAEEFVQQNRGATEKLSRLLGQQLQA